MLKSLAMTGSVDIARMTAQRNGQGEWFEQQLKEKPDLPDDVKKIVPGHPGIFRDDDDTFNSTLDKYVTPGKQRRAVLLGFSTEPEPEDVCATGT
ncbi:hypothetical protein [Enterobacter hormaechei]|uniref:hypothetical protein n=1 Tax=Enterobacter hormaechei TaxID=158836 RepID=UPI0015ECC4C1|nr:hypothetical protein [Enterobacter hormaechei]MBA2805409.1 hypothetical protein [Enterobacter hormaechei]